MFGRRAWLAWTVVVAVAVVLTIPVTAWALTVREGNSVAVLRDEAIEDDLYAFGNSVTIDGTVEGDVVAFGQFVVIKGYVRGSVITAAQTVRIDVLAGAGQVNVSGEVERDLAAAASGVNLSGLVGRNLMTSSESLVVSGIVGGDADAHSTRVTLTPEGSILGDLDYWSATEARVQGSVAGATLRHEPPTDNRQSRGPDSVAGAILGAILGWIQSFVGFLILGLLMVFALPGLMKHGSQAVINRLPLSLGVGLFVFFGTPMAAGFVFVVGLFVGAWWLAFVLFAVYGLLLLAGTVVGSLAVGRALLTRATASDEPALAWSLLLGLVVVWIVAVVPFLGWLAAWAVMLTGAGALVLLWMGKGERPAVAQQFAEPSPGATGAAV